MRTKTIIFYQLILVFFLLTHACAEERTVFPSVQILQPSENQSYAYGDTIDLIFTVQNGEDIQYSLQRDDNTVQVSRQLLSHFDERYEVAFYLDNKYLEGGNYQIKVKAFNGSVSTSEFLAVNIKALPLLEKGLASLGSNELMSIDSSQTVRTTPLNGGFNMLAISSRFNEMAVAGESKPLAGYNFHDLGQIYSIPPPHPAGAQQYYQVFEYKGDIITVEQSGAVRSYGESGTQGKSISFPSGKEATQAAFIQEKLALSTHALGSRNFDLEIWNEDFLGLEQSVFLGAANNVLFSPFDEQELAIFINDNNGCRFLSYSLSSGQLTSYFILNQIFVNDCEFRQSGEIIFSTNEGVYTFSQGLSPNPTKVLNFGATDIEVSRQNGRVLVLHNNSIKQLNAAGNLNSVGPAAGGAQDFEILYNK